MCVPYWWCTKHAQLIMGTWPIYKKHFLQLILTKKTLSFDKIYPRDLFVSFLFNLYLFTINFVWLFLCFCSFFICVHWISSPFYANKHLFLNLDIKIWMQKKKQTRASVKIRGLYLIKQIILYINKCNTNVNAAHRMNIQMVKQTKINRELYHQIWPNGSKHFPFL